MHAGIDVTAAKILAPCFPGSGSNDPRHSFKTLALARGLERQSRDFSAAVRIKLGTDMKAAQAWAGPMRRQLANSRLRRPKQGDCNACHKIYRSPPAAPRCKPPAFPSQGFQ